MRDLAAEGVGRVAGAQRDDSRWALHYAGSTEPRPSAKPRRPFDLEGSRRAARSPRMSRKALGPTEAAGPPRGLRCRKTITQDEPALGTRPDDSNGSTTALARAPLDARATSGGNRRKSHESGVSRRPQRIRPPHGAATPCVSLAPTRRSSGSARRDASSRSSPRSLSEGSRVSSARPGRSVPTTRRSRAHRACCSAVVSPVIRPETPPADFDWMTPRGSAVGGTRERPSSRGMRRRVGCCSESTTPKCRCPSAASPSRSRRTSGGRSPTGSTTAPRGPTAFAWIRSPSPPTFAAVAIGGLSHH
jgi:hypothetical protein